MVSVLFGFGGRLGRLHYFLLSLLLGFVMMTLVYGIFFRMMPDDAGQLQDKRVLGSIVLTIFLVVTPIFLWFSLALQTKRIRDIGWRPLPVILGWIGANVLDTILAVAISPKGVEDASDGTALGLIVNAGMALVLLFWPGRPEEWTPPSHDFGEASPAAPARRVAVVRAEVPPAPVRAGFGRKQA